MHDTAAVVTFAVMFIGVVIVTGAGGVKVVFVAFTVLVESITVVIL